jgi:single-stranded DNA-binding protein
MICNQTLAVNTGRNQSDLFNFSAINSAQDKLNQAELLANFTRKGTGLTIRGRLVTDSWIDKDTKEKRAYVKIQLVQMTLAPKVTSSSTEPVAPKPQTQVASTGPTLSDPVETASLWGTTSVGLPDLPGVYSAPTFNESEPPF